MSKRVVLVAILLSLTGLSCRITDDLPLSPQISKRVQPTANCVGRNHLLVPNEYLGSYWQNNGVGNWQAIDEIAEEAWQLDGYYIMEYLGMNNSWARFGFTNVGNPHPAAVVSDMTLRFFAEYSAFFSMDVEVFVNGNLVRSSWVPGYGPGIVELEVPYINMGSLASMNTLEVRFRSAEDIKVHSLNVAMFSYVPNPDCPDPHQE